MVSVWLITLLLNWLHSRLSWKTRVSAFFEATCVTRDHLIFSSCSLFENIPHAWRLSTLLQIFDSWRVISLHTGSVINSVIDWSTERRSNINFWLVFMFFDHFILFQTFSFIHCSSLRTLRPTIGDSLFTLTIEISLTYWWIIDALLLSSKCLITRLHFLIVSEIAFKITSTVQVTEIVRKVLHFSFISKCWFSILERHLDVCSSSIDV